MASTPTTSWEDFSITTTRSHKGGVWEVIHKDYNTVLIESRTTPHRISGTKEWEDRLVLVIQRKRDDRSPSKSFAKLFRDIRKEFPESDIKVFTLGDKKLMSELISLGFKQDQFGTDAYIFEP